MNVEVSMDEQGWKNFVRRIERKLTLDKINKIMHATAYWGLRHTVEAMPKRTGALKRSWKVIELANGQEYRIASDSKIALFIEEGTRAHGPKKKKYLYIPLHPNAAVWRKGFVYGQDYILVKQVKGIKGIKYLKPLSKDILSTMVQNFVTQMGEI